LLQYFLLMLKTGPFGLLLQRTGFPGTMNYCEDKFRRSRLSLEQVFSTAGESMARLPTGSKEKTA